MIVQHHLLLNCVLSYVIQHFPVFIIPSVSFWIFVPKPKHTVL